jgi:translation initiation factor 2 gamma subunit (eIF-2gamma)
MNASNASTMIVATAGHIDHGKTLLVRTLTGVDTDRLPEEKARGISIDLGFAYGSPAGGPRIGFVDVPGHERFVRTMVAGVCVERGFRRPPDPGLALGASLALAGDAPAVAPRRW